MIMCYHYFLLIPSLIFTNYVTISINVVHVANIVLVNYSSTNSALNNTNSSIPNIIIAAQYIVVITSIGKTMETTLMMITHIE
ncbi:hypothetical protein Scep_005261 [Stephania cephalantha]|uniref:Uncharacterized protein n=1 Tax=Stephania cephalantha TaxID=152367 RepID=A0AAP0KVP2_9MAGN